MISIKYNYDYDSELKFLKKKVKTKANSVVVSRRSNQTCDNVEISKAEVFFVPLAIGIEDQGAFWTL